jgi:serine/threonine protein kinase
MTNVQEILCPTCHASNPRHAQHCQQCGHEVILKSATRYYHITHVLKQGGQGAVFRALGNDTYTCAIKQMLDRFTDPHERTQAVKRFKAEADILQRLRHPCIPNIYDLFEHQGYHYLVMEFVSGSDLEDLIRREGYIPEARALQWANQICDVLEYLHRQQPPIIFRDLKPSNIMIEPDGNVKLIDFGIAKVFQPVQAGTIIGTPGYAPPEQYQGRATPQSDIFALGATLHHMLTGRDPRHEPPFSFPPVYALRPDISRRTSDAIQKALQMKVEDRYTSVTAFRQALLPQSNPPIDPTIPLPGSQPPSVTPSSQKSSVAPPSPNQKPVPPVASLPPWQQIPSITIAILGVGMSWLSSIFFPFPEKEIKMYLILTMFLLSFSGSMSYILTRSPGVAFVTQVLYVMYQIFFVDGYISLFGIIQSFILYMFLSKFEHLDASLRVIIGNACIGIGIIFLAFIARSFQIPGVEVALEWLVVFLSYVFGALIAIIIGKILGKC